MKKAPKDQHLDVVLRSSALVAGGFMGDDDRSVTEVIDSDAGELFRLGISHMQLASRMQEITVRATEALGSWLKIDDRFEAMVDEARGSTPCPWPHEGSYLKRVTTVRRTDIDQKFRWSDLSIHLIGAHGFFEGRGSEFRIEPAHIVRMLFPEHVKGEGGAGEPGTTD